MKIRDLNVKVIAFPVAGFDRQDLQNLEDAELIALAKKYGCTIYSDLEFFQIKLNNDLVDVDNNWIIFVQE